MILFFDLPSVTDDDKRLYRHFVKDIQKEGFVMMQESVYLKLSMTQMIVDSTMTRLRKLVPSEGMISVLVVTEKQFATIEHLIGEPVTDIINTDERLIEL
ncbi:MAG: CRISPR-associated endonuclease Cas2 [Bacilli bacterium]|jgi:CRISPR-associated protein Cas2|nr:CRISPR-associated endonuclease Cas2 [Bacilli bacterium]